ncbi:hypothetical protein [Sinorhizobium americanum]|uniref:Uncharacterized protein n=1 Tax=Sinorhizobium americanum TaxID=194963 RepID=A0A4R2BZS8_9HYPH|nr:hypothetical protein [Sinorhizobium americanum]TCN32642.1 hypothetical protein EV184_104310 [Sinorhizobium americanum]
MPEAFICGAHPYEPLWDISIVRRFASPKLRAAFRVDSLPETADNVFEDFGVSRADLQAVAAGNQARGAAAK